jgi:hypothetical protein
MVTWRRIVGVLQRSKDSFVWRLTLVGTVRWQGEADNVVIDCEVHNVRVEVGVKAVKNE